MLGRSAKPGAFFSFALPEEICASQDGTLEALDQLLQDHELLRLTAESLASRRLRSRDFGRPGIAPEQVLRCLVLKHWKGWSFRQLHYELHQSLLYRRFTRFFEDPIPHYTSFSRVFALFIPERTRQIHQRVMQQAQELKLARGRKLRVDTTAVETNIHYPTDSSLLVDSLRVMTRCLKRIAAGCAPPSVRVVDHRRAAKYRLLEIIRAAKTFTQAARARFLGSYRKLLALTGRVRRQAGQVLTDLREQRLKMRAGTLRPVLQAQAQLEHYLPLVDKIMAQTQARIFQGQTHYAGKVLSLFEEHTAILRKGKADKPNEFGRLVRLDEVENGLLSGYAIGVGNPAEQPQWLPALEQHRKMFGRAPRLAAADRGFWSLANEQSAQALGIRRVVLPATGRLSAKRAQQQKQRWFRRGQAWRAGEEARISTLKHQFGMKRAHYKGDAGFQRYVGWCIIVEDLVAMARRVRKAKTKLRTDPADMNEQQRKRLLEEVAELAPQVLLGSLSRTYRRCGNRKCRCHFGGPKHGPHLYVSYRGPTGKTTGYYVPEVAHAAVASGVEAWHRLQACLRQLSLANKERLLPSNSPATARKNRS
ncbi:MAG TPA: ISNCY family transposase [Bacillota bacterium]|nr:ISNCY family transposase [Bacillota bacterium]